MLVVKLDNTVYAQPHAGLTKADVVYIEEVEYGITRLAAVFSSTIPARIGPVRSARITDVDLLAQYDRPAFAYSGAQRRMFPALDGADFYDVSPRTGGAGYSRDGSRRAPYNYYVDGHVGLDRAPKASLAKDQGFVFDDAVPEGGLVAKSADMKWGYSSAGFDYRKRTGLYAVSLNGRRAGAEESDDGQNASTVVIQYVKQRPSAYFDKGGGNTPHADTIGTGRAVVMRDGLAWDTTLEPADGRGRHDVHAGRRIRPALQARPGLDRAARQEAHRGHRAADASPGHRHADRHADCDAGSDVRQRRRQRAAVRPAA